MTCDGLASRPGEVEILLGDSYCNLFTSEAKRGYGVILDFEGVFDIPECDHSNEAQHHIRVVSVVDYLFFRKSNFSTVC